MQTVCAHHSSEACAPKRVGFLCVSYTSTDLVFKNCARGQGRNMTSFSLKTSKKCVKYPPPCGHGGASGQGGRKLPAAVVTVWFAVGWTIPISALTGPSGEPCPLGGRGEPQKDISGHRWIRESDKTPSSRSLLIFSDESGITRMNHDAFCSVRQARRKRTNPVGPPFYEGPEEWGGAVGKFGGQCPPR